jgi:hypothetical protein
LSINTTQSSPPHGHTTPKYKTPSFTRSWHFPASLSDRTSSSCIQAACVSILTRDRCSLRRGIGQSSPCAIGNTPHGTQLNHLCLADARRSLKLLLLAQGRSCRASACRRHGPTSHNARGSTSARRVGCGHSRKSYTLYLCSGTQHTTYAMLILHSANSTESRACEMVQTLEAMHAYATTTAS